MCSHGHGRSANDKELMQWPQFLKGLTDNKGVQ